jgi:hypothetical protein
MKILDVPMSGSANWRTASRNRNGQYLRTRSIPVQPRTTAQLAIRGFMALASQTWRTLTDGQREAWRTYGLAHPRTDSLGQSNPPTGAQAYAGINTFLLLNSLAQITDVPADPDFSAFVPGTYNGTEPGIPITGYVRPAGGQIAFYVAQPRGPGVSFFGKGVYVMSTSGALTTPVDIAAAVIERWGTLLVGAKYQVEQVPWVDGVKGAAQSMQFIYTGGS